LLPPPHDLPDAATLAVGAYRAHRLGHTGRGVRVGLADTGVGGQQYFAAHGYRWTGDAGQAAAHGTGMAAVLFAVAPDITVVSARVDNDPVAALQRLENEAVDLVLCSWGVPLGGPVDEACRPFAGRLFAASNGRPFSPASLPIVHKIAPADGWPSGPYRIHTYTTWRGTSVAAALACGVAAILVGAGHSPLQAAQQVAIEGPKALSNLTLSI